MLDSKTLDSHPTKLSSAKLFINYASEDRAHATWLVERLNKAGITNIWLDRQNIAGGDQWRHEIDNALANIEILVAILTPASIDPNRKWIRYEQMEALRLFKWIIPVMFEQFPQGDLPPHLAALNFIDFVHDREGGFHQLIGAIQKRILRPGEQLVNQTPTVRRPFVGREQELHNILEIIEGTSSEVRNIIDKPLAIQGMGGLGKTMIAEELVRRLAPRFPGGVIVERRGQAAEAADSVLQRWAEYALGRRPDRPMSSDEIRSMLQHYGRMLILIDDVTEEDFSHINTLLASLPPDSLRIITTRSRHIQTLGCELFSLGAMSEEDGVILLKNRLRSSGGDPDAEAIRRLIKIVGGHALSLELMAGRCGHSDDLPELVDELSESIKGGLEDLELEFLTTSKENSVAHSLALSLRDLQAYDEQKGTDWTKRFKELGIFPDNASMDKALITAAWGEVSEGNRNATRALNGLYKRAMINRDIETGLFFNHPLLRTFASGLLRNPLEQYIETRRRYIGYITLQAASGFRYPPEEWDRMELYIPHIHYVGHSLVESISEKLGQLRDYALPEENEILSVLVIDQETTNELQLGAKFAEAVSEYVNQRPEIGEMGREWMEMGLVSGRILSDRFATAQYLKRLGLWHRRSNYDLAMRYFESALQVAQELNDDSLVGEILSYQGEIYRRTYNTDKAISTLEEALDKHRKTGNRKLQALTLGILGETWWLLTLPEKALEYHYEALAIYKDIQDIAGEGDMANMLGSCYFISGIHDKAIEYFNQALEIHRKVSNRMAEALDLNDLGASLRHSRRWQEALAVLNRSLTFRQSVGGLRLQVISMEHVAACHMELGDRDKAIGILGEAQKVAERLDIKREISRLMWSWGRLYELENNFERSLEHFFKSLEIAQLIDNRHQQAGALGKIASIYYTVYDRKEDAEKMLAEAIELLNANKLTQGFGGMYVSEMQNLRQKILDEMKML